ncbi:hypothetical protein [Klebsiella phage P55]|uniref:Uncharacterized protein n=1 Tax=Klebsiella phage P55 TaxID=3053650 RepID=A0AA96KQJ1_9CAUD|nr:hypothetical protein [Klebsiella phage P55]
MVTLGELEGTGGITKSVNCEMYISELYVKFLKVTSGSPQVSA